MKTLTNCAKGALSEFEPGGDKPWNATRISHLFRRMGYGISPAELRDALAFGPGLLVDQIVDTAAQQALPEAPPWANWTIDDYSDFDQQREDQYTTWTTSWVRDMINNGFREKMELFWSNHFVTQISSYLCPSWMYQYHRIIQEHALGNFKDFVRAIGTTPAMLVYLNGVQNSVVSPNENYARELYELFTLGRDNGYTQMDIEETARALTGWVGFSSLCAPINFLESQHDQGQKTIFGKTGNWGYEDVHEILFEEKAGLIAKFICEKLYRHFVHPQPNPDIVEGMAQTFLDNDFELVPVLRQLFKSEHFFDDKVIGTVIKSPLEYFISFIRSGQFTAPKQILEGIVFFSIQLEQQLFEPVDVAGWPGNRSWVNNNTITNRWRGMDFFVAYLYENYPEELWSFARDLIGQTTDPFYAASTITDFFLPNGLQRQEDYERVTQVFKHEIPQNYFDNQQWNLDWEIVPAQVTLLLFYLIKLPEFQLS